MIDVHLQQTPIHEVSFLNAGAGKKAGHYRESLPFLRAQISGLPSQCPPLMLSADLQGRSDFGDLDETLLGCSIPDHLFEIEDLDDLPPPEDMLAILAGDFYTLPNASKRGGSGPVDAVWESMEDVFSWTVGVAGNHDTFRRSPQGLLDGNSKQCGNLRVAGISGIIGSSKKPNRREPNDYENILTNVLSENPDILVLHDAPHVDASNPGNYGLTEMLLVSGFDGLLVCGHVGWEARVQKVGHCTCLNVHEAVVLADPF